MNGYDPQFWSWLANEGRKRPLPSWLGIAIRYGLWIGWMVLGGLVFYLVAERYMKEGHAELYRSMVTEPLTIAGFCCFLLADIQFQYLRYRLVIKAPEKPRSSFTDIIESNRALFGKDRAYKMFFALLFIFPVLLMVGGLLAVWP